MKAPKNQINMDTVYFADSYRDKVYEVYGESHAKKICPTCLPGLGAFFDFESQISNHISLQIEQKPDTQQNPAINTQQKQVNMYVQMKDVSCIIL